MNDSLLVCRFQRLGNLSRNRQRLIDGHRTVRDAIGQRRPLDELHHECLAAVNFLQAVEVRDVGMIQGGKDLSLSLEPGQALRVRAERILQHLQRVVPLEQGVARAPYPAHSPFAKEGSDFVQTDAAAWADGHRTLRKSPAD